MKNEISTLVTAMMDNVIRKYGFENEKTISFCTLCENSKSLLKIVAEYYIIY